MRHILSTHLFVNHRLTAVWLDRVWDAGFPAVEIFCARQHLDYRDRAQINELAHWFRDAEHSELNLAHILTCADYSQVALKASNTHLSRS